MALPDGRPVERHAGHHAAEHERITRIQRQLGNLLCVDDAAAAARLGFEQLGRGSDLHALVDIADIQRDIDSRDLAHFQREILAQVLLESGGRRGEPVASSAR